MFSRICAVVCDKYRKRQESLCSRGYKVRCEPRFARTGRPRILQLFGRPEPQRRGSWSPARAIRSPAVAPQSGRAARWFSVAGATLVRFSARVVPPWASTICLEIDRPSPVLAESMFWSVGVKTLENLVDRFGADTWPVVIDQDFHHVFQAPAGDAHGTPRRRKRTCVVDQVADDLTKSRVVSGDLEV